MRVNIYAEELTTEVEVIEKHVDTKTFYGIRLYLESSNKLHQTPTDDDRSAVTFWVPFHTGRSQFSELLDVFTVIKAELLQLRLKVDGKTE